MVLGEIGGPHTNRRLLARQPRAPWRRPAGAVSDRPADTRPTADELAAERVELEGRRAASPFRVVCDARRKRVRSFTDFMIANQTNPAVTGGERRHAVVGRGRRNAIAHHVAGPAEREVLEIRGQEQKRKPRSLIDGWLQGAVVRAGAAASPN